VNGVEEGVVIAERELLCTPAGESPRRIALRVRAPVRAGEHWLCEARIDNLFRDVVQAQGVDSLQALQLALEAIRRALAGVVAGGGRLEWADGSGEVTAEDLLR
jgi:hypothetical protein